MKLTKYNAKDTTITVKGVHITGLGENMWNFEKKEALAEDTVGAQGDVCRNEINDPIYTATIGVQRTSPQYNFLKSLKDEKEPFSVMMNNPVLGITEGGTQALVSETPASVLGKSAEDVEFAFTVYDGNSTVSE